LGAPHVTGSAPIPAYPAAGAHQADLVGTEPPLGFSSTICPARLVMPPLDCLRQSQLARHRTPRPWLTLQTMSSDLVPGLLLRSKRMTERARPDLASAMYPSLSRETKERETAAAQWRAGQNKRNQQLAADLRAINVRLSKQTTSATKEE
jgi:hypothetical protein